MTKIDGNKVWVNEFIDKKRGTFNKLMEAMNNLGIEVIDINVTTYSHKMNLITTCVQGTLGSVLAFEDLEGDRERDWVHIKTVMGLRLPGLG